jgi:hypothetical protein
MTEPVFRSKGVVQLIKKFPRFMEPEGSLPCSTQYGTELYFGPNEYSQHPDAMFPTDLNTLFLFTPEVVSSFQVFRLQLQVHFKVFHARHMSRPFHPPRFDNPINI